jgi:hypothetical protein
MQGNCDLLPTGMHIQSLCMVGLISKLRRGLIELELGSWDFEKAAEAHQISCGGTIPTQKFKNGFS